jgi:TolB-like protein
LSAKDGGQLWFQSYECEIRDVFEIQDEITAAIIGALAKSIIVQRGAPYGRSALFDR